MIPDPSKIIQGIIRLDARGEGRIFQSKGKDDAITIPHDSLATALDGDTVVAEITKKSPLLVARVNQIVARKRLEFVGILEQEQNVYFIHPDDRRMYIDILIPTEKIGGAIVGEKVLARITDWTDAHDNPRGEILRRLGNPGAHEVEMQSIVLERGFRPEFDEKVEEDAKKAAARQDAEFDAEVAKRRDFRSIPTCTIDPLTAKDFDDAISFQKLPNGNYEVGIHIADVSWFVRPGTPLDDEARRRATSIYLVDRTIPMLPEVLSNDKCSLNPDTDRFTFSAVFELDENAEIKTEWFGRTIIHSDKRFVYEDAQAVLDTNTGTWAEPLTTLNALAYRLREKKMAEGALVFEDSEVQFALDKDGVPLAITKKVRTDIHKLVEDFMLLANRRVAGYVSARNHKGQNPFVYRIHDAPDADKLHGLAEFLAPLGYDLVWKGKAITAGDINRLLAQSIGKAEEGMGARATVRAMAKAIYSTNNIGHYGLGFEDYTHFTSPIRRYPDILVHRLLAQYLSGDIPRPEEMSSYAQLAAHSSEQERLAAEAERESIKYKQVEYMAAHIGIIWQGVISGVTEWGIYVEDGATKTEGMLRFDGLPPDDYEYLEKKFAMVGKRTKKTFRLGDRVTVKVKKADPKRRIIDLELVEEK